MTPIYGSTSALRAQSNSNSPGNGHGQPSSALLVVPQPINATKMTSGLSNGTGRKYQCKMCPQVRQFVSQLTSQWQQKHIFLWKQMAFDFVSSRLFLFPILDHQLLKCVKAWEMKGLGIKIEKNKPLYSTLLQLQFHQFLI